MRGGWKGRGADEGAACPKPEILNPPPTGESLNVLPPPPPSMPAPLPPPSPSLPPPCRGVRSMSSPVVYEALNYLLEDCTAPGRGLGPALTALTLTAMHTVLMWGQAKVRGGWHSSRLPPAPLSDQPPAPAFSLLTPLSASPPLSSHPPPPPAPVTSPYLHAGITLRNLRHGAL